MGFNDEELIQIGPTSEKTNFPADFRKDYDRPLTTSTNLNDSANVCDICYTRRFTINLTLELYGKAKSNQNKYMKLSIYKQIVYFFKAYVAQ